MRKYGPWKIKSSEVKYKSPWLELRVDQVIQPDGKESSYGTFRIKDGASVLAVDDEMNVYLTEEFHYGYGDISIEVVAGGTDAGEDVLEGAKRELLEETGIMAEEWIDLGVVSPMTSYTRQQDHLYLARELKFTKDNQEGTESIRMLKVPLEKAVEMVMQSKIVSAESCALILKAAKYLGTL